MLIRPDLARADAKPPRRDDMPVAYTSRLGILEWSRYFQAEQMGGYSADAREAFEECGDRSLAVSVRFGRP